MAESDARKEPSPRRLIIYGAGHGPSGPPSGGQPSGGHALVKSPAANQDAPDQAPKQRDAPIEHLLSETQRLTLGRAASCELCFPDDSGLSRQHLAIAFIDGQWQLEDLGSKNGTLLNRVRIERPAVLHTGDLIQAGRITLEVSGGLTGELPGPSSGENLLALHRVEFVEQPDKNTTTVVADLDTVLGPDSDPSLNDHLPTPGETSRASLFQGNPQTRALIRAGRELAGHRPLHELFEVIMDLSMEAVSAGRGVLMTVEDGQLRVRSGRGEGFKISGTVRDRVLKEKSSLLVRDTQMDQALREQNSIVLQKVRSFIAVPLQTQDRVIGLIYVDQPDMIREFTPEDLGLLTVMANVAAIRIEHARLNEVEALERALAKELDQAAQIQLGLLPALAPAVKGFDLAGRTLASRAVGGDYYDYLIFPDGHFSMIVGDVAGKGLPASLLMSSLQARVQVLFENGGDLAGKITRLNKATAANCPDNRFITFFMMVADPTTGEMTYCNAGHNPPLLVRKGGDCIPLEGGGLMLGIIPMAKYQESRAQMDPGDTLLLYSDGVTEATNLLGEEFGEERLQGLITGLRDQPAAHIVDAVHQAVADFAKGAPQFDDITVVVARRI